MRDFFLNLLFPKLCVSCGVFGSYLCQNCAAKIKFIETPICPVCERSAIGGATHPGCQTRNSLDGLISACVYCEPIKAAIKRLKYKPWITDLGEILTSLILKYIQTNNSINYLIELNPVIIPVPLHKNRERQRGFNQSEILGRLLAEKLNLKVIPNLLVRHIITKPQADLEGKERLKNIRGAFSLIQNSQFMIHNSNVLLIDDVWTTGATLRACGGLLKAGGAKKVWTLTLAR